MNNEFEQIKVNKNKQKAENKDKEKNNKFRSNNFCEFNKFDF